MSRKVTLALLGFIGLVGIGILLFNRASVQEHQPSIVSTSTLEWLPSETAPIGRPVYLVQGNFILPDGTTRYIPDQRVANAGWGKIGSTHILDDLVPLPVAVEAVWYSLTENIAYSGQAELPVAHLSELFATGVQNPLDQSAERPDRLVLGMAPGGDFAIWAVGINSSTLIGMYPAEPIPFDIHDLLELEGDVDLAELLQNLLDGATTADARAELALTGPQRGLWKALDTRYRWHPVIANTPPLAIRLRTVNGELEWLGADTLGEDRAAPEGMIVYWQDASTKLMTEIDFDLDETRALFAAFTQDRPLQVRIELAQRAADSIVTLTDGISTITFNQAKMGVFSVR